MPSVPAVLIENAPGSGDRRPPGSGRRGAGVARGRRRLTGDRSTRGRSRPTRDWICCMRQWRSWRRRRPDARLVMVGGEPAQVERRASRVARCGLDARDDLHRSVGRPRTCPLFSMPRTCSSRREHRHEHAAEDLPVPPVGQADRRHASATHTQVLDDDVAFLAEATPEGFAAGDYWRDRAIRRARQSVGAAGAGARGDEVQL